MIIGLKQFQKRKLFIYFEVKAHQRIKGQEVGGQIQHKSMGFEL